MLDEAPNHEFKVNEPIQIYYKALRLPTGMLQQVCDETSSTVVAVGLNLNSGEGEEIFENISFKTSNEGVLVAAFKPFKI